MSEIRMFKPEEKMKIVLGGLNGTFRLTEMRRKYGIDSARLYEWKDNLIQNSVAKFDDKGRKSTSELKIMEDQKMEITRPKDAIAEVVQENLEIKNSYFAEYVSYTHTHIVFCFKVQLFFSL
jgi:transposase-like protein